MRSITTGEYGELVWQLLNLTTFCIGAGDIDAAKFNCKRLETALEELRLHIEKQCTTFKRS